MKTINLFLIILISILLLTPVVSATTTEYIGASASATVKIWPLVSLGIEKIPSVSLTKAVFYYNWISMGILFLIGAMSSKRMTRFFAVLIPIFAGMMIYMGWLISPNPITTWGTVIMCGLIGATTYMKGSLRENFGGGGPGNLIINVVYYIILLQACVGIVNATGMWVHQDQGNVVDATTLPEYMNNAKNAQLDTSITTINDSGGWMTGLISAAGIVWDMVLSVIKMLFSVLASLILFSYVINSIFPFIGSTPLGVSMLVLLQLGIYLMYVLFFVAMFGNKPADSTAF